MESSIDLHFEDLEELLSPWRAATVAVAAKGVPPHITLLYPWSAPPIGAADLKLLEDTLIGIHQFTVAFTEVRSFPNGAIYLGLEDERETRSLIKALSRAFPELLPYGGEFPDPVPHLTIAKVEPREVARSVSEIKRALRDRLPIRKQVDRVVVMVEDLAGGWSVLHGCTLR